MVRNISSRVLDIGARYGVHPSWKKFTGEKNFFLVEADPLEAKRLVKKYINEKDISILSCAVGKKNQLLTLNILKNPAMSSTLNRLDNSPLFWGERKNQKKIKKKIKIKSITLDQLIKTSKINFDFLKIDVEGQEVDILKNSKKIFDNLLGVRSEVIFSKLYNQGKKNLSVGTFVELHKLFINKGFILLNFDYNGKGEYFSNLISPNDKYGVLQSTDAVWIKDPKYIIKRKSPIHLMKLISFLILNNGIDLALYLLEKNSKFHKNFKNFSKTKLFSFIKISVLKHLYGLKWLPNQSLKSHKIFYEKIFNEKYPSMNKYNERDDLNP